jgi:sulfite exporter TauE/SafE
VITLLSGILVASLLGSLHCVAMCGPLIGLASGARSLRMALVHALGRLTTYVALGVAAGFVGRAIDLAGRLGEVQRAATIVAGAAILAWAGYAIAIAAGWRRSRPARATLFRHGLVQLRGRRPTTRTWLVGVLTGLLPCGWLWAFVVSAAGTGSPVTAAAVMAVFWLGTVPAMTGVLAFGGPLIDRLRGRLPIVTAVALVLVGIGTLSARWTDAGTGGVARPSCHEVAR